MRRGLRSTTLVSILSLLAPACESFASPADYVIHISADGLRPDAVTNAVGDGSAPNFARLRSEGAFTDNARTDFDFTVTLPNHTTQLTGRPVLGPNGHLWTDNGALVGLDPAVTLHSNNGAYVASSFDVAHDHGLRTAMFASKVKFALYDDSYNADSGAPDVIGTDNGTDKIDLAVINTTTPAMVGDFVSAMTGNPFQYSFLHFHDTDSAGHGYGWNVSDPNSNYMNAVRAVDGYLGTLLDMIDADSRFAGRTAIVLTADHGGQTGGHDHSPPADPDDYTIPFYAWGAGVAAGDLYALNSMTRFDPLLGRPDYTDPIQPIRNGDAANLAMRLLGLEAVPGSTINAPQDLVTQIPEPAAACIAIAGVGLTMSRRRARRPVHRSV